MPHRRGIDTVLEYESVPTCGQPMQAGGNSDRTRVAMIAQPCANLLDTGFDIGAVGETIARRVDLIDIQSMAVDQRAEGFPAAFSCARRDGHRRTIPQPNITLNIGLSERLFQPLD